MKVYSILTTQINRWLSFRVTISDGKLEEWFDKCDVNPKDGTISAAEFNWPRSPKASCIADKLAGDGINLKELKGRIEGAITGPEYLQYAR